MAAHDGMPTTIPPSTLVRWYVDTRSLTTTSSDLPLLSSLQPVDQKTVTTFYHLADRHMSLASYLLKYLFIHRAARVPWHEITISRTPPPLKRPHYRRSAAAPENDPKRLDVEFNISHQASITALAGCAIPSTNDCTFGTVPLQKSTVTATPTSPQIGIDITCVNDITRRGRGPDGRPRTERALYEYIDMFEQVFSVNELDDMKTRGLPTAVTDTIAGSSAAGVMLPGTQPAIDHRLRLFYTYWALKESFIKMTGDALLAPWLRELEFVDVAVPQPGAEEQDAETENASDGHTDGHHYNGNSPCSRWGSVETGTQVLLGGRAIDNVRIEIVGFEKDYIITTTARGAGFGKENWGKREIEDKRKREKEDIVAGAWRAPAVQWELFRQVRIDQDIGPCARGECHCLD